VDERFVIQHECRGRALAPRRAAQRDVLNRVTFVCSVQFIDERLFDSYDALERHRLAGTAQPGPVPLGAAESNGAHKDARTARRAEHLFLWESKV
jgi:hypothetical protein